MKLTITICAYNRPEYLRRVLNSLNVARAYCPEFDASVHVGIDPGGDRQEDVLDVARSFAFCKDIIIWPEHHGVSNAPRQLLQYVFTQADSSFNLHLEDDTVLSPDALRLCHWFYTSKSKKYYLLSLHSRSKDINASPRMICPRYDFGVWGWACHSIYWTAYIGPRWNHRITPPTGWDYSLTDTMKEFGLVAACPALSRVHNIGREGGAHQTPEGYDEEMKGLVCADKLVEVGDFFYSV